MGTYIFGQPLTRAFRLNSYVQQAVFSCAVTGVTSIANALDLLQEEAIYLDISCNLQRVVFRKHIWSTFIH